MLSVAKAEGITVISLLSNKSHSKFFNSEIQLGIDLRLASVISSRFNFLQNLKPAGISDILVPDKSKFSKEAGNLKSASHLPRGFSSSPSAIRFVKLLMEDGISSSELLPIWNT